MAKITNARYIQAAREGWHEDGVIEVDEKAKVSKPDSSDKSAEAGAYVQAWIWIPDSYINTDEEDT